MENGDDKPLLVHAILTSAFLAASASPTIAADNQTYVTLRGAYVNAGTTDNQFSPTSPVYTLDYGSGYGVSGGVGRTFGHFRAELNLLHIRVGPNMDQPTPGVTFELSDRYWMGLLGAYYDIDLSKSLSVYVGGGGGIIDRRAELTQNTPLPIQSGNIDEKSFGFFSEAGASIVVSSSVSTFAAFRYVEHNDGRSTSSSNFWVGIRKNF